LARSERSARVVVCRNRDAERAFCANGARPRAAGAERLRAAFDGEIQAAGAGEQAEDRELGGHQTAVRCVANESITSAVG
jgi:hypothetical protein